MSLLAQVQQLTERNYKPTGANFEEFLISYDRFVMLSQKARETDELSTSARVFFRMVNDRLYVAIYYSSQVIEKLEENDPRSGLSEQNITEFCIFVEEINHAVHGSLKYLEGHCEFGQESFLQDLELQAKVDTYLLLKYFVAYFNKSKQLEGLDRLWLRYHLFENQDSSYQSPDLSLRYEEANQLGEKYTRFIDALPPRERLKEIRTFRRMPFQHKRSYINMLP